jgi:hypothetical protein
LWGRAAFDAVGPLLLIGCAEVGPGVLRAIISVGADDAVPPVPEPVVLLAGSPARPVEGDVSDQSDTVEEGDLVARARSHTHCVSSS